MVNAPLGVPLKPQPNKPAGPGVQIPKPPIQTTNGGEPELTGFNTPPSDPVSSKRDPDTAAPREETKAGKGCGGCEWRDLIPMSGRRDAVGTAFLKGVNPGDTTPKPFQDQPVDVHRKRWQNSLVEKRKCPNQHEGSGAIYQITQLLAGNTSDIDMGAARSLSVGLLTEGCALQKTRSHTKHKGVDPPK